MSQDIQKVGRKSKVASGPKHLNSPIHNELMKRLKVRAIEEEITISALMHRMLCHELGRTDLIDDAPESAKALSSVAC